MEFHEAANIFPLEEETLQELGNDIKENGQYCPIEVFKGKILDGRRRYEACKLVGVKPEYFEVDVPDPISYVLSLNLLRRNLTQSQKAIAAIKATDLYEAIAAESKEKQEKGVSSQRGVRAARPEGKPNSRTRDKIAKVFGASGRSVEKAKRIKEKGTEEVVDAVEKGKVTVTAAERIVKQYPKERQNEALKSEINKVKPKKDKGKTEARQGSNSSNIPKGREDWAVPNVDKVWQKASLSAGETISDLTRSPLLRLSKSNPHRGKAFDRVITWLKERKKET